MSLTGYLVWTTCSEKSAAIQRLHSSLTTPKENGERSRASKYVTVVTGSIVSTIWHREPPLSIMIWSCLLTPYISASSADDKINSGNRNEGSMKDRTVKNTFWCLCSWSRGISPLWSILWEFVTCSLALWQVLALFLSSCLPFLIW